VLSNGANCTLLRAAVLAQYRRVTDGRTDRQTNGQTDGIAIANTALAMRALRAVKTEINFLQEGQHPLTGQRFANFRLLANQ